MGFWYVQTNPDGHPAGSAVGGTNHYGYISQHGDKPNKLKFSLGSHLDYTVAIYQLLGTAKIALYLGVGSEL